MITILLVIAKFFSFQPFLDGKDLDIELDSTADSEKEDSEEEEDDDPFSNAPPRQEPMHQRTVKGKISLKINFWNYGFILNLYFEHSAL